MNDSGYCRNLWEPHESDLNWLNDFRRQYGRAPRLLHIGNIANAAYLNSKMLNTNGVDCDLLVYGYYHIMGCPEWEEVDFTNFSLSDNFPDWRKVDLKGYARPRWFAHGTMSTALKYLIAKRTPEAETSRLWEKLTTEQIESALLSCIPPSANDRVPPSFFYERYKLLVAMFKWAFPWRTDQLALDELLTPSTPTTDLALWQHLMSLYDIVVGYSTDCIYPLMVGKQPYFAYEHGTIRSIPFEDNFYGRLTALAYRMADWSIITNSDAILAAGQLNLPNFSFIPHPINEDIEIKDGGAKLRQELCDGLGADFIAFHPSRQHWDKNRHPSWEKGNDIFIKGFAKFVKEVRPTAGAVFVEWGKTVNSSKALLAKLGVLDRVLWIKPQPAYRMAEYIQACDVLADQFYLGAWGSTMPRGLFYGSPVMIYLNEDLHNWCFPEMPPVLNTQTSEQVFEKLCALQDIEYKKRLITKGRKWYDKYHSNRVIVGRFLRGIREALNPDPTHRIEKKIDQILIEQKACMVEISSMKKRIDWLMLKPVTGKIDQKCKAFYFRFIRPYLQRLKRLL